MEDSGCGLRQGGNFFPEVPISTCFIRVFTLRTVSQKAVYTIDPAVYGRNFIVLHQIPSECIQILCADFSIEPEKEPESSQTAVNGVF